MNANYFLAFKLRTTTVTKRRHNNEDKLNTQLMTVQKKSYKNRSSYINVRNKL